MSEQSAAPEATADVAKAGGPPEHNETIVQVLASKVLVDWLRNRQQLLVPFKLDFQKLEKPPVALLIHLMAVAALADGAGRERAAARLETALALVNATDVQRAQAAPALDEPQPLSALVGAIEDVQAGGVAYAACLLTLDRRDPANRHFARYLVARLQLPEQLARAVEQRFRAPLVAQPA